MSEQTRHEHAIDAISRQSFERDHEPVDSLLSVEALPASAALVDFSTFVQDYPEKLLPLLDQLRPEFQEFFLEYYVLHKSQKFLGATHGCIQTRIWQALRIIEQALGALLVLGIAPEQSTMREILTRAGLDDAMHENVRYGDLSAMIATYADARSYAAVAKKFDTPIPIVRKIFRPAIKAMLASHDLKVVAVGAYLRNLTHQASLRKTGVSKSTRQRLRRAKTHHFVAPPLEIIPLLNFGHTNALGDTPWVMFEPSWEGETNVLDMRHHIQEHAKKIFGKHPAQVFTPTDGNGKLLYGYVFARSTGSVRGLLHVPGISSVSTHSDDFVEYKDDYVEYSKLSAIQIPDSDVQKMIASYAVPAASAPRVRSFVEILTGPAAHYCGLVTAVKENQVSVKVEFPTKRQFTVTADVSSVKVLVGEPAHRTFWGIRPSGAPLAVDQDGDSSSDIL